MIKKPKSHLGLDLMGIKFSERWNIVEQASKQELERYISLYRQREAMLEGNRWNWEKRRKAIPLAAEMINMRKTWRMRYGLQFSKEKMYQFDRSIARYDIKLAPKQGPGQFGTWSVRTELPAGYTPVSRGTILHYSHSDEIGNHYFYNLEYIDSPYLITFKRDDKHLASIIPME